MWKDKTVAIDTDRVNKLIKPLTLGLQKIDACVRVRGLWPSAPGAIRMSWLVVYF